MEVHTTTAELGVPPPLPPAPMEFGEESLGVPPPPPMPEQVIAAPPALPTPPPMPDALMGVPAVTPDVAAPSENVDAMNSTSDGKESEKRPLDEAGEVPAAAEPPRKKRKSRFDDAPPADAMPPPIPGGPPALPGIETATNGISENNPLLKALEVAKLLAAGRSVTSNAFSAEIVVPPEISEDKSINFIGLVIGPQGMTQKMIMNDMKARVNIKGRGSSKSGPDEDPDRDLYVAISADSQDKVDRAKVFINALIASDDARRLLRDQQNKQRQAVSRFADPIPPVDGLTAPDGTGTTAVAPSPWGAQGMGMSVSGGNASAAAAAAAAAIAGSFGVATQRSGKTEVIKIPSHRVGIVIGRCGGLS